MAVDFFLKIDGIEGESSDAKHKNEIDVLSWSWGATQTGTMSYGGGGGAGVVNMKDFQFSMRMNKATPKLMQAVAGGDHIKKAVFVARKAGKEQQEYMKITFTDVMITRYETGGATEEPVDNIELNFAQIEMAYMPQDSKGNLGAAIPFGWNLKEKKKV
jgi:type VI secretion system secreted protein Hcp